MRKIDELKSKCKELAAEIRTAKSGLRLAQKSNKYSINDVSKMMLGLRYRRHEYRHYHIAYCELRGRTRDQIEPKVKENNFPNPILIEKIKADYAWEIKEEGIA